MKIPSDDFLALINAQYKSHLQHNWAQSHPSHLKNIKPILRHWSSSQNNRLKETVLSRLRIGHTRLTHAYKIENNNPPICQTCTTPLTLEHILLTCPIYRLERRHLINYIQQKRLPCTLQSLLGDADPELTELLLVYLHNTRLDSEI